MASWLANLDEDWVSDASSCQSSPTSPASPSSLSSTLCAQQTSSSLPSLHTKSRIPRPKNPNNSTNLLRANNYGLEIEGGARPSSSSGEIPGTSELQANNFNDALVAVSTDDGDSSDHAQMPVSPASTVATQDSVATQIRYCPAPVARKPTIRGVLSTIEPPNDTSQPLVEGLERSDDDYLKKRILEAVTSGGQFQDLFSPMNLEKLFKPLPSVKKPQHSDENTPHKALRSKNLNSSLDSQNDGTWTPPVDRGNCETNETLPLATSTVRGSSKQNGILKWKTNLLHNRKNGTRNTSMFSQDSNENFSPIYLSKEGTSACGPAHSNRSSPLKIYSSPNNTADLSLLNRRRSEPYTQNPEEIHDESMTARRKSAKRTSMGNAKLQSPGTMPQDHHSSGPSPVDSSHNSSSSLVCERTPKRRRLSNSGKQLDSYISIEDAECPEAGSSDRQPKGTIDRSRKCLLDMLSENKELLTRKPGSGGVVVSGLPETVGKVNGIAIMSEYDLLPKNPTSSFRTAGSVPIKTIPPSSVSHILPKQIGQMTFDDKRLMWVKNQQSSLIGHASKVAAAICLENEDTFSDDDPLKDISDLSAGDIVPSHGHRMLEGLVKFSGGHREDPSESREESKSEASATGSELTSKDNRKGFLHDGPADFSTQSISSDQTSQTNGNALSYQSKDCTDLKKLASIPSETKDNYRVSSSGDRDDVDAADDVDDLCETRHQDGELSEASVPLVRLQYEDDYSELQEHTHSNYDYSGALGIKYDFSSVLRRENKMDDSSLALETPSSTSMLSLFGQRTSSLKSIDSSHIPETPSQRFRVPSLRYQNGGSYNRRNTFVKPIISSIHEESGQTVNEADELKIPLQHHENLNARYQFSSPFKPDKLREIRSEQPSFSTRKSQEVSFFNTPLPELSYHYLDAESAMNLEISYVAKLRGDTTHQRAITSFSAATHNLVKNLTDIEPYEPYWEYTRQLRLVKKGLMTLHPLNEFCPRIEDLNVQGNELGQVTGVPTTVRELNISDNCLSSLTTWGHLLNLQYLDISRNGLDSLAGLKHLVHLRELRADENKITDIKDVAHLDGLLFLSARRNRIQKLDLSGAYLKRLNVLDLKGNEVDEISNLHLLSSLSELNLDNNCVTSLGFKDGETLNSLRTLKLNKNMLESLDIAAIPNIRVLYLDDNRLKHVENLSVAKHLDSFSIRQQNLETSLIPLDHLQEVRKLYITGNHLSDLAIRQDFPNLQYLEMDFARLTSLPDNFGVMMNNVRVLNLNYNAISDLRPLYGILRLKKLSLAGNRLNSLKKIASMLKYFPTLRELDLRYNPLTVGFYSQVPHTECVEGVSSDDCQQEIIRRTDDFFKSKIDIRTAIQRRCYEIVVGEHCSKLSKLDGLKFSVEETLRKDALWEKMEELGIVGLSAS